MQQVKRKKAPQRKKVKHKSALVIGLADWQIGAKNTEKAVDEYFKSIHKILDNLSNLRRKYDIEKLVLVHHGNLNYLISSLSSNLLESDESHLNQNLTSPTKSKKINLEKNPSTKLFYIKPDLNRS